MKDRIGEVVSHYRILEPIGQGGMGVVYKAHDSTLDRTVALKFLSPTQSADPEARQRLLQEARSASSLDHPNICTIFEINQTTDGEMFVAMAYYEGESLSEALSQRSLTVEAACDIAIQVSKGLVEAHRQGIIHRDIKPSNILLTRNGVAKIVDFGLARPPGSMMLTKAGSTLGTVTYMSPEQARGESVDRRTDIWSLGVLLYQMLTGEVPFGGDYETAVAYNIINSEHDPPSRHRRDVPPELDRIVHRALAKSVSDRYARAEEMLADLEACFERLRRASLDASGTRAPAGRRRTVIIIGVVTLIAAAVVAGIFLMQKDHRPEQKSIAVLPFKNLSGGPEDEYFSDGMTEDIITQLSRIGDLKVISRTSVMPYKNKEMNLRDIGKELGVQSILEGSVRKSGNRIRIVSQLIDTHSDEHLWAETYDRELKDIFDIQSEVAGNIARTLKAQLIPVVEGDLAQGSAPTGNMEAYDAFLKANDYASRVERKDLEIAADYFATAIQKDTAFALAYARLGHLHAQIYWYHYDHTHARTVLAKEAIDRAFALNPQLPDAHISLAYYYYWCLLDYERALAELEVAQKSRPAEGTIPFAVGSIKRRQGHVDEALAAFEQAFDSNPRSSDVAFNLGETMVLLRKYDDAERTFDRAIYLRPDWAGPYVLKSWTLLLRDANFEKTEKVLEEALTKTDPANLRFMRVWVEIFSERYKGALALLTDPAPEDDQFTYSPVSLVRAHIYGLMGDRQAAESWYDSSRVTLESLVRQTPDDPRFHSALGITLAGLGRKEDAVREGLTGVSLMPVSREAYRGTYRIRDLAMIYAMTGNQEAAIDQLQTLLSMPSMISRSLVKVDPFWKPLRTNPRFQKLVSHD